MSNPTQCGKSFTMAEPALPANIAGMAVLSVRMIASIAHLRGHAGAGVACIDQALAHLLAQRGGVGQQHHHAHGAIRTFTDPAALFDVVAALTQKFEGPWSIHDAPRDYIDKLCNAITGIEIPIEKLEGKWKVSQNRPEADRRSVAEALAEHPMGAAVKAAL